MTRPQLAGRRLVAGHRLNVGRIGKWVTEQKNPKSTACRAGVLVAATWILWQAVGRGPVILWPLVLGWLWCAWRSAKPQPPDHRRALAEAVLALIGDRPGIFVRELYPALLASPYAHGLDEARLRAALTTAGITVHKKIRIGKEGGLSGVRREDVEALLSPAEETPPGNGVDAGQDPSEGARGPAVDQAVDPA